MNCPSTGCPLPYVQQDSQSRVRLYTQTHSRSNWNPLGDKGCVFYKHLLLKCFWSGCSGAATGAGKACTKRKRKPFLNRTAFPQFQSIRKSMFLGKPVWQAAYGRHSHTGVLGFQAKEWVPPSLRSHFRVGNTLAVTWCTGSK